MLFVYMQQKITSVHCQLSITINYLSNNNLITIVTAEEPDI